MLQGSPSLLPFNLFLSYSFLSFSFCIFLQHHIMTLYRAAFHTAKDYPSLKYEDDLPTLAVCAHGEASD